MGKDIAPEIIELLPIMPSEILNQLAEDLSHVHSNAAENALTMVWAEQDSRRIVTG